MSGYLLKEAIECLQDVDTVSRFEKQKYLVIEKAFSEDLCRSIIPRLSIDNFIKVNAVGRIGFSRFHTTNGKDLADLAPELLDIYHSLPKLLSKLCSVDIVPLDDFNIGFSMNYTSEGGRFAPHFDRNLLTVSLYLNRVRGGELVVWPRSLLPYSRILGKSGRVLSTLLTKFRQSNIVSPAPGTMVVFTDESAHAVNPVLGDSDRVSVILAYDLKGKNFISTNSNYYGLKK